MKPKLLFLSVGLASAGMASAWAQSSARPQQAPQAAPAQATSPVNVEFVEPNEFTDLRSSYAARGSDEHYLNELRRYINERAPQYLSQGQQLQLRILNVDMAGDFEPHRGAEFMDVRIVKDIYPPRIHLQYTLTDASGQVIDQGDRRLSNLAFTQMLNPVMRDDPLRYEKQLLSDFLSSLGRKQK